MKKLRPAITMTQDPTSGEVTVEYSVFSPGKKLAEKSINQVQADVYNNDSLPGVRVELELEIVGAGNPLSVAGSFVIDTNLDFDETKPYLDLVLNVWDNATNEATRKGGGIVRHQDIDMG